MPEKRHKENIRKQQQILEEFAAHEIEWADDTITGVEDDAAYSVVGFWAAYPEHLQVFQCPGHSKTPVPRTG
jgi:hypothetical protein